MFAELFPPVLTELGVIVSWCGRAFQHLMQSSLEMDGALRNVS